MALVEIDKNKELYPGDVVELHFKALGPNWLYLRASEMAVLQWRLAKKHPNYKLISWSAPGDKLILRFRVQEPVGPVIQQAGVGTAAVIAAAVIAAGVFTWLSLDKVYQITDSPAGQVALAGAGSAGIGLLLVAIVGVYLLYTRALK
jgi:hypothetical protein